MSKNQRSFQFLIYKILNQIVSDLNKGQIIDDNKVTFISGEQFKASVKNTLKILTNSWSYVSQPQT